MGVSIENWSTYINRWPLCVWQCSGACVYPRLSPCKENSISGQGAKTCTKWWSKFPKVVLKRETAQNQKKEGGKVKNQQIQKKWKWKNRIRRKERKETTKKKWRKHETNRKRKENRNGNGKIQKMRQGKRRKTNKKQKKTYRRKKNLKDKTGTAQVKPRKKTEQETLGRKTWTMIQHLGQKEKPACSFAHMHTLHNWSSFCALRKKALWGWVLGRTCLPPCKH